MSSLIDKWYNKPNLLRKPWAYDEYQQGRFGNKLTTWSSVNDWRNSSHKGNVVLRYSGGKGGGKAAYNLTPEQAEQEIAKWLSEGVELYHIKVNESAPDECLTIQGEVCRSIRGLELRYGTDKVPMRVAMENPKYLHGVSALLVLQDYLWSDSYEDIMSIFDIYGGTIDQYQGHVVEFSAYSIGLGCLPSGRNTLIWEVRNY